MEHSSITTSTENIPLSTKSPRNRYFSEEGSPPNSRIFSKS